MDLKALSTNETLEEEGVWQNLDATTRVKLARIGNTKWRDTYAKLTAPFDKVRRAVGKLDDETANDILCEAMSVAVLLDWEGMTEGGVTLEYSQQSAKRILLEYKDLRNVIFELASDLTLFRNDAIEEAAGNLPAGSDGS